jgi:hypothetical protein
LPGTKAPELNAPEELVVTSITKPVSTPVMVTSAPLRTAPEGSLTLPTTLPVSIVVWASDGQARIESDNTGQKVKHGIRLDFLGAARMI